MRRNFLFSGVLAGIRRNAGMTIALILSTAIALGFVGAALLANKEISQFKQKYEDKIDISVYLCTTLANDTQTTTNEVVQKENLGKAKADQKPLRPITCATGAKSTDAQVAKIKTELAVDPTVKSFTFVSEQKALDLAKAQQPVSAQYLKLGDIPASYTVKLSNVKADYLQFAARYSSLPGIDMVNNQSDTINTLLGIIDSARWFSLVIALVVLLASILLIANTIQTAAAQRKNETSIMRLVGASRWMTELPFMLEAVFASFVGGLVSIVLIWIGKSYVMNGVFSGQTANGVIPNLSANDVLVAGGTGLLIGVVLSAVTAIVTLRFRVRL